MNKAFLITTMLLAIGMISYGSLGIKFEDPKGIDVYADLRMAAIEGNDITLPNSKAKLLLSYIQNRQANSEFRIRLFSTIIGLIILILSSMLLRKEYNQPLKNDAGKSGGF